ncbi:serine O-acetyltransferase [Raoultibacter massiliensis]|uniref:serine O-acetyltransferase n=1 Tax=Raoultibacter massiliensis TaxID=1852371 RepID=UPI000C85252D
MNIFKTIGEDIAAVKERDPAAQNSFVIWLTYPGLHARWSHVVEHWLWTHGFKSLARISSQFTRFMTGVEIHPAAVIGRRFFIDHAMGVIIGETTVIGDDVTLYQGVTLGGTGNETGKRHPTLGNNVLVGVGASVLGNITIGDNSKVGGGAVVVRDVPPNCTVVGIPGKIVIRDGKRVETEKQDAAKHRECLPDPVTEECERLAERIDGLERKLREAQEASAVDLLAARIDEVERRLGEKA